MTVDFVSEPSNGRVFAGERRVRLGDVTPRGRLRLDALVGYLQDVADDDTRDAGFVDAAGWVVRRTVIEARTFPTYLEPLRFRTWCGGIGGRWAERRTSVRGEGGGYVEAATLWVHVDPTTLRPQPLTPQFRELYAEAAAGRVVRVRLLHGAGPDGDAATRRWPLRFADFDVLGHVNNAAYWVVVEDELGRRRDVRAPLRAELEHRGAFDVGTKDVEILVEDRDEGLGLWMRDDDGTTVSTAAVRRVEPAG